MEKSKTNKKVTMKEIAEISGVSKATVSMVLNNKDRNISKKTKEKVLKICKELNYVPNSIARSLATKRTNTIGVIIPDITNPFFAEMGRAIEDFAKIKDYNIILCNTDNLKSKEQEYVRLLVNRFIDGVILISGDQDKASIEILESYEVPFVLVDRYIDVYNQYYRIYCDNVKGIEMGIDYLCGERKRKKVAFVTGNRELEISNMRLDTYKRKCRQYGTFDEDLIYEGDFTLEKGMSITEEILKNKEIDGIFYSNDLMALGGLKVLIKSRVKVPQEISIVGYDDIKMASIFEPELTTISQPVYEMGKKACGVVIDLINGNILKDRIVTLEPKLIRRNT